MNSGPVFIVGMKHSGKSSIGKRVARYIGVQFSDLDREIEAISQEEIGRFRPVRSIYRDGGWAEFARLETIACRRVSVNKRQIIAAGGGICDNEEAVSILADGSCILLDEDCETLFNRIIRRGVPPFLETTDTRIARNRFAELYDRRMPKYREMADVTVDLRGLTSREAMAIVTDRAQEQIDGWK